MQNQTNTNRYQHGKIYQILCNTTGKKYVGSTCTPRLCHRLGQHVRAYRRYLNGNCKSKYTSFGVLECNDYKIYLLERCPCESKEELLKKEREYIERLDCVNKFIPGRSKNEYYEANKEKLIEYQKEYQKEHYKANREKIIESQKEYNKANKEKIIEYKKVYYQKNKEHVSAKFKCECGCEIRRDSLAKHRKTKKHLEKTIQFTDSD